MIDVKRFSGALNLDTSTYALPPEDYTDALNITHDAVIEGADVVISNVVANALVSNSYLPNGRNKVIGAYPNNVRGTIIFMNWNENDFSGVYEYTKETNTIVPVFENLTDSAGVDVLGFTENDKISSINIYNRPEGDLLFFIDSLGRPTFMDINRMKAKQYIPVTRFLLDLAKRQPLIPPSIVYGNDSTRSVNYLRNRFFRFRYRYVYDDDFKSTYSPISVVLIPVSILDIAVSNNPKVNNIITLSLYSGDKDVKAIEIAMSYAEKTNTWFDFATVTTINKDEQSISDNSFFSYEFTNDSTYPTVVLAENDLLYDFIPLKALCQEMPNGNVIALAGITEGYDKDTVFDVTVGVGQYLVSTSSSGSLNVVTSIVVDDSGQQIFAESYTGTPAVGTVLLLQVQKVSDSSIYTAATYTTVAGDNGNTVAAAMAASANSLGQVQSAVQSGNVVLYTANALLQPKRIFYAITVTPPTTAAAANSIPAWKWSTSRRMGIAYFDQTGRTNGILYNTNLTFPAYAEDITGANYLPYITASINNRPPIWAYSYQFLFTKENTYSLFWVTNDVLTDPNYIYFEVTDFIANAEQFPTTTNVLEYTFQDGDRLRQIKTLGQNAYLPDTFDAQILGYLDSPTINGVQQTGKRYLKINKVAPFTTQTYNQDNYVIEIYRPQQQPASSTNLTYYECGLQYDILNPATANRCHAGMLQDQTPNLSQPATFEFKNGDWYFRIRNIALSESGSATFNVMDRNVVDTYISAVNSIDGRPNIIDLNAKEAFFGATVRHGQAYQANTNINGLNRFYPQDFIDVDYSYGDIRRLKTRDRVLRVFQNLKVGNLPLFSRIAKSPSGDEVIINTNSLLNPIQYYVGDWGIGTCPESLASFNFADYFCDNIRGAICRVSNSGVEPLSLLYKVNSWATNELILRKGNYKIYGCFEQRQANYMVAVESTPDSPAQTLIWDEEGKRFDSFVSYHPEMMVQLGTLLVTFKDGNLWTHNQDGNYNNFYGVQYDSYITGVFNKNVLEKKTFLNINEIATEIWDCPEIETSSNSYGNTKQASLLITDDFADLESNFSANFLRDINSNGDILNGDVLKGNWIKIKLRAKNQPPPNNNIITLSLVSVSYIDSYFTNR